MKNSEHHGRFQKIVDLVSDCTQIPIRFYDEVGGKISLCSISQELKCSFRDDSLLVSAYVNEQKNHEPILRFSDFGEIYAALPVTNDCEELTGIFIIGPGIIRNFSSDELQNLYKLSGISISEQKQFIYQRERLALVSDWQMRSVLQLVNHLINGSELGIMSIRHINSDIESIPETSKIEIQFAQEISNQKTTGTFHTANQFEKAMLRFVKEGNVERLYELINTQPVGNTGKLAKNLLRHHKNQFIVSTSLACRAAIEGGMNTENAYSLSDIYLQTVEDCKSVSEILNIGREMLFDYARAVSRIKKQKDSYSKPVRDAIDYIYIHLRDKLELKSIAAALNYSPNYLGQIFRGSTGYKLSEFVAICRIDEARQLLRTTNNSINEVSSLSGFGTPSYFCTVFKNSTGLTPEQYRNNK